MTQFRNRIPDSHASWCVITQMLWVNQVLNVAPQLICAIMCCSAFHSEARTSRHASVALIIISALSPVSVSCSHSRSLGTWRRSACLSRLQAAAHYKIIGPSFVLISASDQSQQRPVWWSFLDAAVWLWGVTVAWGVFRVILSSPIVSEGRGIERS